MAADQLGSAWPNRKSDYELRDVIGEHLNICDQLKYPSIRLIYVEGRHVIYFT